jgi:tetratricopeptide (TPR) repeat protein
MVCRLLKALEGGRLPDDGGELDIAGIVYLSPVGGHPVSFPNLFADLCRLLPEGHAESLNERYRDPQQTPAELMLAVLEAFPAGASAGPSVVLLDNFEDLIDEAGSVNDPSLDEALRALLTGPDHGVKVVLTTRVAPRELLLIEPGRQRRLNLDEGLGRPFAENILRAMDPDASLGLHDAPDELLALARERTRGFPRALEALAAILSADRDTTLPELLAEAARLPGNVVEALVGEAFSRLDPLAQQVMQALAVFPVPVPAVAVDYLLQPYRAAIDAAPVLGRLVNMAFVRRDAGRYYLHQVDRDYALARIPAGEQADRDADPPPFTQQALRNRGANYFQITRTPRATWRTLDDLAPQLAEFELRWQGGDYDTAATVLAGIDFDYLRVWGHYRTQLSLHARIHGKITDPALNAAHLTDLGTCHYNLGEYRRAIDLYTQSLDIYRDTGNRESEGVVLGGLGNCHLSLGGYRPAIDLFTQALAIARDVGNRQSEGGVLGGLGICYSSLGEYRRAIDLHTQALAIARDIGNRQSEGNQLGNMGNCHFRLGGYRRAIDLYTQALDIAREIGDRGGEGSQLGNIGICHASLGDYRRAIDLYTQSLDIARDTGDRYGEDVELGNLGNCHFSLGEYRRAIDLYTRALAIDREIGDRSSEGQDLGSLGLCHFSVGDYRRAIDLYSQALDIAREIGDRYGEANALNYLGRAWLASGDPRQAVTVLGQALDIADTTGDIEPAVEARSGLARAQLQLGDPAAALGAAIAGRELPYPVEEPALRLLEALALLALDRVDDAVRAFSGALAAADALLALAGSNIAALQTRALALSGLAVAAGDPARAGEAVQAFNRADAITTAEGVVADTRRLLDAIAARDRSGVLAEVRAARGQ